MNARKLKIAILLNFLNCGFIDGLNGVKSYRSSEAYLVENSLQPSEQDVPLEEFFWTGSGDGPYIKPKEPQLNDGKYPNTVVRTATVLATVYIDGNYDSDLDPLCVYDCDKKFGYDGVIESIDNISPTDRRYWLLTVVAGLFSPKDFPILEEKLAKLYRIAFLRQQYKHLGFTKGNETTFEQTKRKKRSNIQVISTKPFNNSELIRTRKFAINKHVYERQVLKMKKQKNHIQKRDSLTLSPITQKLPYEFIFNDSRKHRGKKFQNVMLKVKIHDLLRGEKDDARTDTNNDTNKIDVPHEKNQTEIIYSVIIGGKPVLASTAAEDMRLVENDEVTKILENEILLKAEPYLKEAPEATPLSPSYMNGSNIITTYVDQNPLLIALTTVAAILLILLLVTLLLYGRSKRRLVSEKKQSAAQALVQKTNVVDDDINTIHSDSLQGVGVDNLAFEKGAMKAPPVLHFPPPPPATNRPSSSSSSSDSSVYYPKRRYKFNSVQDLLHSKNAEENDKGELYMSISNTGKAAKKNAKERQQKRGRTYKTDNRVGSSEQAEVHLNQSGSINANFLIPYQEHNEAFNPNVSHYQAFSIVDSKQNRLEKNTEIENESTAEAINKELIQKRHGRATSADSNSIGSFLSMASVRSFPKCAVPEPKFLQRVLEPVSVSHLDHSDADIRDSLKNYSSTKNLEFEEDLEFDVQTQSDGADPGVVGPVVWEMHKKGLDLSTNSLGSTRPTTSPQHDPQATRNRFEGLLEGAMKLYSTTEEKECQLLGNTDEDQLSQMPGLVSKAKETRGRSAATIRLTSRTSGLLSRADFNPRPTTADPQQVQNPVPTIRAWSGSNIVRPLSAGVYHKPSLSPSNGGNSSAFERTNYARAMSASPIIDAIQEELKKISNNK